MEQFEYLIELRKEILEQIGLIEDADGVLWWDSTPSNSITSQALIDILDRYVYLAENFGILVVTRHCNCPNRRHPEYPTSNAYGQDIPYPYCTEEFVWDKEQLFQGDRACICPCSSRNKLSMHPVIDDILFRKSADLHFCRKISNILLEVAGAIESAGNRRPRSGIRESLLMALVKLNDAIMPQTVGEYIELVKSQR